MDTGEERLTGVPDPGLPAVHDTPEGFHQLFV
jgi:hypothetical protein